MRSQRALLLLFLLLTHSAFPDNPQAIRLAALRAGMEAVMGPLPASPTSPPQLRIDHEKDLGTYLLQTIALEVEPGDWLPCHLALPKNATTPAPAILALHQTNGELGKDEPMGLGGKEGLCIGKELAERGFVVLAPDYPNFGTYKFDPYTHGYASATMKGIYNHRRCIDYLASLSQVDPSRIAAAGHSLGGHNSLFLAAFDDRVRAVVTSCGFNSFHKYYNGDLTGWSHKGYMPRIDTVYFKNPNLMPFNFPELLAALAPRAVFINAPLHDENFEWSGVRDCVDAAGAVYRQLEPDAHLVSYYPDCGHEFPAEVRQAAYRFVQMHLP